MKSTIRDGGFFAVSSAILGSASGFCAMQKLWPAVISLGIVALVHGIVWAAETVAGALDNLARVYLSSSQTPTGQNEGSQGGQK